ncbi:holo-[acyl-carrier protein] synthase [Candidatus Kryptonium thompsonii]|uniref:Holo-[acyl-carrier-protein] synthase n=1 Tax=Candidatus Kryptonium thompsonii TaxID=1633631 RepID=A0A0P1MPI8_9BACT|nr:holo-ACP synthase [Candidatus Kryptonium thompsoni]CUS77657.1 holo-[acyl-carrier protein] synthase [Candidatus Kryptonium thompsoni]CUS81665.1 holo-[acyl-carrier protein] synthase [Candidatus Kryptonium thompsoni]CUS87077.1 holo-[acyl-carrier protein] synthase [Candidatus Kryptonium thompsoni]CUS90225.1 holo-[acyl-carrier protein] synthase [Candidatus Kryptonium thompsoni]CUS92178.1 holo-[acyl-carrier protein] synthase [Candidatus Kryptonium thompsoni]
MIMGVGVDIVEIERFKNLTERWGEHFLKKIFTQREIDYCLSKKNKYQHLAGRFAAKEAISKAISTGWSGIFKWKDVEILNDEYGKPEVILYNQLKAQFESCSFHISISHSLNYAVAFAVVERN